jgi:mRNA interferase MazF
MAAYIPDRGDIVHLDFSPSAGREMAGPHYAVTVSPRDFARATGKAVVCPITSTIRNWPFEVRLPAGFLPRKRGETKDTDSAILCDQFRTLDYAVRKATKVNQITPDILRAVIERILPAIDPALQ